MSAATGDGELGRVVAALLHMDPDGARFARVYRETFDQLYDGQRTGRYKWDDLYKTEKTHFGTLIEINLQREFDFADGDSLDYRIAGVEVDCKYSYQLGGWMLPPESWGKLVMVSTANDQASSWSLGVVRVTEENRRMTGHNRDGKTGLNVHGRAAITWVFRDADFSPNVLLQLPPAVVHEIFQVKRGQARLDALFRQAQEMRIHRNAIATVAQQQDYMKRVRSNGGSRSRLREEGFLIVGGDYKVQRDIAEAFGVPVPRRGELVSFRVRPANAEDPLAVAIDGAWWRKAERGETISVAAPLLPGATTS
ncbi:MAG: NaeI family type II restriction endonuclease [Rhodoglobus sp.]